MAETQEPRRYNLLILATYEEEGKQVPVDPSTLDGGRELEPAVNRDLQGFAKFYREKLNNMELSDFEAAAIKTFIYWKTHPELQK